MPQKSGQGVSMAAVGLVVLLLFVVLMYVLG